MATEPIGPVASLEKDGNDDWRDEQEHTECDLDRSGGRWIGRNRDFRAPCLPGIARFERPPIDFKESNRVYIGSSLWCSKQRGCGGR